jgi:hypothetical protein
MEIKEPLYAVGRNENYYSHFGKQNRGSSTDKNRGQVRGITPIIPDTWRHMTQEDHGVRLAPRTKT